MKIIINYDLLSKISEAKTGFSFQRTIKPVLIRTGVSTAIFSLIAPFINNSPEETINHLSRAIGIFLSMQMFGHGTADLILTKHTKRICKNILMMLSAQLK